MGMRVANDRAVWYILHVRFAGPTSKTDKKTAYAL